MHLSSDTGLATSLNTADICLVIIQPDIYNRRPARMVESKLLVDRNNCNLYVFYTYIHTLILNRPEIYFDPLFREYLPDCYRYLHAVNSNRSSSPLNLVFSTSRKKPLTVQNKIDKKHLCNNKILLSFCPRMIFLSFFQLFLFFTLLKPGFLSRSHLNEFPYRQHSSLEFIVAGKHAMFLVGLRAKQNNQGTVNS